MIFGPELIGKVLSGAKTVTRRRLPVRYQAGRIYAVQPGRGKKHVGHISVVSASRERLRTVMLLGEARREGFRYQRDFTNYWERLHGPIQYSEIVTRIAFRLAPTCAECALGGRE